MYKKHCKEILFQMLESDKVKNEMQKKKLRSLGGKLQLRRVVWVSPVEK